MPLALSASPATWQSRESAACGGKFVAPPAHISYLAAEAPMADLARAYLAALLRGERRAAAEVIHSAIAQGIGVREIYLEVFQKSLYEIGRLWQLNDVSVAQEHFCTAATQLIMSQLYPHIFAEQRKNRRIVATCVGGDLHEIGVRMVADFLELDGWDTYYLGANAPTNDVVAALVERNADVLGVSATMRMHLGTIEKLVLAVHAHPACRHVKILVGGQPFNAQPELGARVGADGVAPDAARAVAVANSLVDVGLAI